MGPGVACEVLVVSRTSATSRREAFSARARSAGVSWKFFDACTDLGEGLTHDAEAVERNKGRPLTGGEIGCYSSHFSIWRGMVARGVRQAIVLEDDTIVDWKFLAALTETDLAAHGIRYLRLFAKRPAFNRIVKPHFIHRARCVVEYVGYPYGTQGYALTISGAQAFLRACRVVTRPIDDQMDRSWEHGIANLAVFPAPVIEEFVDSGIGAERFSSERAKSWNAPRQRLARWFDRQRIRARKLSLLRER